MAGAEETGGGGTASERAILCISLATTVISFLLSINTVRQLVSGSMKRLKRTSHRFGASRRSKVVPASDWWEDEGDFDVKLQEEYNLGLENLHQRDGDALTVAQECVDVLANTNTSSLRAALASPGGEGQLGKESSTTQGAETGNRGCTPELDGLAVGECIDACIDACIPSSSGSGTQPGTSL